MQTNDRRRAPGLVGRAMCLALIAALTLAGIAAVPQLRGGVAYADDGDPVQTRIERDQQGDTTLLPGWDEWLDRYSSVWVEDADHPDREEFSYEVTSLTSSDESIVSVEASEDGDGWSYRAESYGEATLTASYIDWDGSTGSYDFKVIVDRNAYEVHCNIDHGDSWALPSESIYLYADASYNFVTNDDPFDDDEIVLGETDRLKVIWAISDEGADYARVDSNASGDKATVTITGDPGVGEGDHYEFSVYAILLVDDQDVGAVSEERLAIATGYTTIIPFEADFPNPAQGATTQVEPRQLTRSYVDGKASETDVTASTHFELRYDPERVQITGAGAQPINGEDGSLQWDGATTLNITRLSPWGADIEINSSWDEEGDTRDDGRGWHLDELRYDLWFDEDNHDLTLWVDRTDSGYANPTNKDQTVDVSGDLAAALAAGAGPRIEWTVGRWEGDDWAEIFDATSGLYHVSNDGLTITADALAMAEHDVRDLRVVACVVSPDGEELCWSQNDFWFHLNESFTDYNFMEDNNLLPHWRNNIPGRFNIYMENEEYPDGRDFECIVTDVRVLSGAEHLYVEKQSEGDDAWWEVQALNFGQAKLKVTYTKPQELGGGSDSYTFELNVCDTVYECEVWSDPITENVLPGADINLYAQGYRRRSIEHVEEDGSVWYENESSTEGLNYSWELVDGQGIARVVPDADDPQHATLSVNSLNKRRDDDSWVGVVNARVHVFDGSVGSYDNEACAQDQRFDVRTQFLGIVAKGFDRELDTGQSLTIDPTIYYFYLDDNLKPISTEIPFPKEFTYYWSYDSEELRVTNAAGEVVADSQRGGNNTPAGDGPYTVTRLTDHGTGMGLMATDDGRTHLVTDFTLAEKDYRVDFNPVEFTTSADCSALVTLDTSRIKGVAEDQYELTLYVGSGPWDDDAFAYTHPLVEGTDYTVERTPDTWYIRIPGSLVNADEGVTVSAYLNMGDRMVRWWTDGHVSLSNEATHAAHARFVPTQAATVNATGTIEHWVCDACGACFADEACTQALSAESVTTPKLTSIKKAKVTVKAKKYNGKAQTFAPVVKLGSKTLKAGTDYTVSGNKKTKPGTYTMTIKGAGIYGGSITAKFTINKLAQPMKVTTKAVTVAPGKSTTKALKVSKAQGTVSYKKLSGSKFITVNTKNGKVTVKKGIQTGKTYKVKIKVTAAGNSTYTKGSKTATISIKVK